MTCQVNTAERPLAFALEFQNDFVEQGPTHMVYRLAMDLLVGRHRVDRASLTVIVPASPGEG